MTSPAPTVAMHVHPTEGPHHGSLVELGNEDYHAEIVHSDAAVTVYILDSAAKEPAPIDAPDVTINLVKEGTPTQIKLVASADFGDPVGKSSRFTVTDPGLVAALDADGASAKLHVVIDGTAFRGEIAHDHDHAGHAHGR